MLKRSIAIILLIVSVLALSSCGKTKTVKLEDFRCKIPSEWEELDMDNGGERAFGGSEGTFVVRVDAMEDENEAEEAMEANYEGFYNMAEGTIVQELIYVDGMEKTKYEYNYKTVEDKDRYSEVVMLYHKNKLYYISYEYDGTLQKGSTFADIIATMHLEE